MDKGLMDVGLLPQLDLETVVIKYGGAAMESQHLRGLFARDVALLREAGARVVIVHGGGAEITRTAAALELETSFIGGHRVTDQAMAEVVMMVLAGKINKDLVGLFRSAGLKPVGISGADGGLITPRKLYPEGLDLGYVGEAGSVDRALLDTLLEGGFLPVIAPTAIGADGAIYNVNADLAASAIAVALGATSLIYVSDVPGVIVEGAVAPLLSPSKARGLIGAGIISGGMIPKIESAIAALDLGVGAVSIVDGRGENALLTHVTTCGAGTRIVHESEAGEDEIISELNQEKTHA
jgi:acetylglutamate kinase